MPGIAGINKEGSVSLIRKALRKLEHRGSRENTVVFSHATTQGQTTRDCANIADGRVVLDGNITNWQELSPSAPTVYDAVYDAYQRKGPRFVCQLRGSFALSISTEDGQFLARDPLGIAPLYEGRYQGLECFASEPKALLGWAEDIREFPPGSYYQPGEGIAAYCELQKGEVLDVSPETAAATLRELLSQCLQSALSRQSGTGVWLSGGLDSSTLAILAGEYVDNLETFTVGLHGSEDLESARLVARAVQSNHHELILTPRNLAGVLDDVIYYLETCDPVEVRRGAANFLAAKMAADHVPAVLSGDGADELFGGYEYLKKFEPIDLDPELVVLTSRLHESALLRVDRCSAAHGITAYLPFLDRKVVGYAFLTAPGYKVWDGETKWLIRQSMHDLLPGEILRRPGTECWESNRIQTAMSRYADELISDEEFERERGRCTGLRLRSKEELHYYRIFRAHFGEREIPATGQKTAAGIA